MTKNKQAARMDRGEAVLVTTEQRGVFFGYLKSDSDYDEDLKRIRLGGMRNCVYWTAEVRGFIGLAVTGPLSGCRVGPAADGTLNNVTAVVSVTPEATERWEKAPW